MPGSYWIRAIEGKCVSRGGVAIRVPNERITVDTDLLIAGFALSGSVHSRDTPITNVLISLFSKLPIQVCAINCNTILYVDLIFSVSKLQRTTTR
jgi:hypothetical protein